MSQPALSPSIWNTPITDLLRGHVTGPPAKRPNIKKSKRPKTKRGGIADQPGNPKQTRASAID